MSTLSYDIVDVFTDRPFTGNPLAVVYGAEDLAYEQLLALAREFHLSETVFVLPPTVEGAAYQARIFTPGEELAFAGHPSVGVAVAQLWRGLIKPGVVLQECGAGLLPIDVDGDGRATLTGGPATVSEPVDPAPLLAAVNLTMDDFAGPDPRFASCGLEFVYLPVYPDAVARVQFPPSADLPSMCVFSWDEATAQAHSRVSLPGMAIPEDPATGSAAMALGVFLATSELLPDNAETSYVVRQGHELRRPSTMDCSITVYGRMVQRVTITGSVVHIAAGKIAVPPFIG